MSFESVSISPIVLFILKPEKTSHMFGIVTLAIFRSMDEFKLRRVGGLNTNFEGESILGSWMPSSKRGKL